MSQTVIEAKNLHFERESVVLDNVSFSIKKNDFVGIIGPNGGGKTTLLKLILSLLTASKGSLTTHFSSIGYMPQRLSFDTKFPVTTLDLVLMGSPDINWFGRHSKMATDKAKSLLETVGLLKVKNKQFSSLSGGQAQRALLARSLISEPELLILDEPTANVDRNSKEIIYEIIEKLKKTTTLLVVTHELPGILDKVDYILSCNTQVTVKSKDFLCSHLPLGLYHTGSSS